MKEIGLYVHIPFCKKKCLYCDFNSYEIHDEDAYINALCKEIKDSLNNDEYRLKTVFIGGGTPTYIKYESIGKLIEIIEKYLIKNAEITIECNPDTLSKNSAKEYYKMGINRVSVGLQATQNDLLKTIGRIHSYEDFLNCYSILRNQDFNNINIDLMFSLPGQTKAMWLDTLFKVCNLNPDHISSYSLILEDTVPLFSLVKSGKLKLPSEEEDREMYHLAEEVFFSYNFKQYEISNFAKEGYECKHNLIYWQNEEYLGVGAGSHSKIKTKRFWNVRSIEQYIKNSLENKSVIEGYEELSEKEDVWETIFLNLRLNKGLNIIEFNKKFKKDFIRIYGDVVGEMQEQFLLVKKEDNIVLTEKGRDLSNLVFLKFLK